MAVSFQIDIEGEAAERALQQLRRAVGGLDGELDGLGTGLDATDGKLRKASAGADKGGMSFGSMNMKAGSLAKMGLAAVVAGAAAAAAGFVKLAQLTLAASEAGSEQQRVFDRLSGALNGVSGSTEEASAAFDKAQKAISLQAAATDFGDEEISDALSTLISVSGDATKSIEDLDTVLGIAATTGKSTEEVARQVAKARKGNIEVLAELTPLTKEQVAALNGVGDAGERGRQAAELLAAQYGGLADTTGTARNSIKEMSDAKGDLVQIIGRVINQSGALQAILDPISSLFRDIEGAVAENSVALQGIVIDIARGVLPVFKGLVIGIGVAADAAFALKAGVMSLAQGFKIYYSVVELVGRGIADFVMTALGGAIESISKFAKRSAEVAKRLGADGLAGQLSSAASSADGFKKSIEGAMRSNAAGMNEEMQAIDTSMKSVVKEAVKYREANRKIVKTVGQVVSTVDNIDLKLRQAKENVKPLESGFKAVAKDSKTAAQATKEIADNTKKAAPEEWDVMAALDEAIAKEKALEEAERKRLQALAEERQRIADALAEQARLEEERRLAALEAELEALRSYGAEVRDLTSGVDGQLGAVVAALGDVSGRAFEVTAQYREMREAGVAADKAMAASGASMASAIGAAAGGLIEDTQKAAAVRGAFAAAEAILLGATGNVPGAIAAGVASAAHFAVAAGAGGGGGGGGRGAGGRGGGGGATPTTSGREQQVEQDQRQLARYFAEELDARASGAGSVVYVDFSGATLLEESPATARRIAGVVESDQRLRGIDVDALRAQLGG